MINGKNMFTYKVRKIGGQKELGSIIPDDPSNIFEFTNRKRKMINFNDLLFKGIKKSNPVQIDFSSSTSVKLNEKSENGNNIKTMPSILERKDLSISECSNINDLLFLFTKKDKSDYSMKLRNILQKDKNLFNNIYEEECNRIELEIEKIDTQKDKWCRIKEKVLKDNILENYKIIPEKTILIKNESKMEEIETYKFKFIKENMKTFLSNLNERINEVEQKIFNLTANDKEMEDRKSVV